MAAAWSYELPPDVDAPRTARHAVDELGGRLEPRLRDDLRLLVTELVTNGIRHAGLTEADLIRLVVSLSEDTLRVEVQDPGAGFEPPPPRQSADSGWGLFLVNQVADRWDEIDRQDHSRR